MAARSADKSRGSELPLAVRPAHQPGLLLWLLGAYLLMVACGAAVLVSGRAMQTGNEMDWSRALFTSVNAATLTGFQEAVAPSDFLRPGQMTILLLTIGASLFVQITSSMAVVRILRLPYSLLTLVTAAVMVQAAAMGVGLCALSGSDCTPLAAVMQASAALANSGLYLGRLPAIDAWQTHAVLLPLALLGSLGLPVIIEIYDRLLGRRRLSHHAATVLGMGASLYLAALAALFGLQWALWGASANPVAFEWHKALAVSSIMSVTSRTAGLPLVQVRDLAPAMQWIVLLLMAVGANSAGSGGGLKVTTLAQLWRGTRRILAGAAPGRATGIALTWTGTYLLAVTAATLGLLLVDSATQPGRLIFLAFSAVSNVGFSHEPLAMRPTAHCLLAAAMLAGRLLPIAVLWWMAGTTDDADLAVA